MYEKWTSGTTVKWPPTQIENKMAARCTKHMELCTKHMDIKYSKDLMGLIKEKGKIDVEDDER